MTRAIYNKDGWVLCQCRECGELNYVEPHGVTAQCKCNKEETEHASIPYRYRDISGCLLLDAPPFETPVKRDEPEQLSMFHKKQAG